MATFKVLVPCIVLLIYFTSSAYGFIEGLYCGTENCYDGMNLFWLNLLANEDDQLQSMLVSISSLRVTCMYSYLLTHLSFCIWIIVLGVYRESSKVIYSRVRYCVFINEKFVFTYDTTRVRVCEKLKKKSLQI